MTTIFAPSTGLPPAAIAIVRISGPAAMTAGRALAGDLPAPRVAGVRNLRDPATDELLDRALVLAFPGPATATGEDLVELHVHGGRAVVGAVEAALASLPDLRRADPGEFTRRALVNGRIDLAEAEGLGDLLMAETELQRRAALAMADGTVSRRIGNWRSALLTLAARLEASLDFADEADVPTTLLTSICSEARGVAADMRQAIAAPTVDRLRDGLRIVLAGPPNSGKSSLLNKLGRRDAAIVSPIAGTTRDRIEIAVARDGIPFVLTDTAGLRADSDDEIERVGIARAGQAIASADLVLWLGDERPPMSDALWLHARNDERGRTDMPVGPIMSVSAFLPESVETLWREIVDRCSLLVPKPGTLALNARQAEHCRAAIDALMEIDPDDELITAEALRRANEALAKITGDVAIETMLDALFERFCVGK